MQQFFEVKYLAIVWKNSEEVRSIKESLSSEKIEQINTRNYFSELSTYTRLEDGSDGQIGIHFFDESLIFTPCFIDAANNEIPLRKIEDKVSKKSWWIEDGKWKEKYRESPLWNHVGKTQIKLDKYIFYHIDVRANTFSIENLNLYLEDFRASFWELIYKPDSYTTGDAKENKIKTLNSDTLKKMGDFIKFIELILKNPKKELKEIQALKSIKKNKPVSKTFMEIATIGMKKNLTSRDYVESFNVAENKYVHYILNRIFILISRMINIANRSEIGFKKAQQHEQNRLDKYFNKKTLTIDKEVMEYAIQELKEKIEIEKNKLQTAIETQNPIILQDMLDELNIKNILQTQKNNIALSFETIIIKLGKRYDDYQGLIQYDGLAKRNLYENWHTFNNNGFYRLKFDKDKYEGILREGKIYRITGNIERREYPFGPHRLYSRYFKEITNIEILSEDIFHKRFPYITNLELLNLNSQLSKISNEEKDIELTTVIVQLGRKQLYYANQNFFWGKIKKENGETWEEFENKQTSVSLEFEKNDNTDKLKENTNYKVIAHIEKLPDGKKKDDGIIYKRAFTHIKEIESLSQKNEIIYDTVIVKINNKQNINGYFWGQIKKENGENWEEFESIQSSVSLEFHEDKILHSIKIKEDCEYKITGYIEKLPDFRMVNGSLIHKRSFVYIEDIEALYVEKKIVYQSIFIKIGNKQNDSENKLQFFGNIKLSQQDEWIEFNNNNNFYTLQFDRATFESFIKKNNEYKVTAYIEKLPEVVTQNHGTNYRRYFKYIESIELLYSPTQTEIENYESQKILLEKSNWERDLNPQELQELEKEKIALQTSKDIAKKEEQNLLEEIKLLIIYQKKTKLLLEKFKQIGIKKDRYFPNSMTFIQNPSYQGAHKTYKEIQKIIGIDEDLFLSVIEIESIGLLDIPKIYEKWTLLQIIKILIDKFHFIPESNWKNKLVERVVKHGNKYKENEIEPIEFNNDKMNKNILFWYELKLKNGRIPDFILDIKSTYNTHENNKSYRFIMDAKFHEEVDIKEQILELYHKKDYAEKEKNKVFILHPDTKKSVKKKITPMPWANDAYYGEVEMFNYTWSNNLPNHRFGAILVSPLSVDLNPLDNLQRLIGMFLQYGMEDNKLNMNEENKYDPIPKNRLFCIKCGGDSFLGTKEETYYHKGYRYSLTCEHCKHFMMYNYCSSCKSRLIKNGLYWTYHSTKINKPFNIKCPACGDYLPEELIR